MRTRRTAEATDSARFTGVEEKATKTRWPVLHSILLGDGLSALEPLALQISAKLVHLAVLDGPYQDAKQTWLLRHFVVERAETVLAQHGYQVVGLTFRCCHQLQVIARRGLARCGGSRLGRRSRFCYRFGFRLRSWRRRRSRLGFLRSLFDPLLRFGRPLRSRFRRRRLHRRRRLRRSRCGNVRRSAWRIHHDGLHVRFARRGYFGASQRSRVLPDDVSHHKEHTKQHHNYEEHAKELAVPQD